MAYKVIIMPPAKRRLDRNVCYTLETLKNRQAAKSILADAKETKSDCRLLLIRFKYVMIRFWHNMDTEKSAL